MKVWSEAAGILKVEPSERSMVTPCSVKSVGDCANRMAYARHVAHIGTSLRTAFASSTSLMLQTFPCSFEPSGESKALLRNLYQIWIMENNALKGIKKLLEI